MHLAVFGGTGRTGSRVLALALARGWTVTALARNPQKITVTDALLTVIAGELNDAEALRQTLVKADAAVIALGTGVDLQATQLLSQGTAQIVTALTAAGVQRVACLLSGWLFYATIPPQFIEITRDHARQLALLEASSLEWVAVCPPALIDRAARHAYKVAINQMPGVGYMEIGVDDVADFLLRAVVEPEYVRQKVGIAD